MSRIKTQVLERVPQNAPQIANAFAGLQIVAANENQLAALDLYRRGLNVFPLVRGTKDVHFGAWGRLQTTRLLDPDRGNAEQRAEALEIFLRLFDATNIALMCGRTSQNLTVLDCENELSAQRHAREFARRGLRPWVVRTARGKHFLWLSDCEIANDRDNTEKPRGWEIRGHSCFVLTPPSIHPSGAVYEWLEREGEHPPVIERAALDWLELKPSVKARIYKPFEGGAFARLFKSTREFCEHGARCGDRNNRLFKAACDFQSKGFSLAEASAHLLHGCDLSGYDKSFTRRQAERTITSAYKRTRNTPKPNAKPISAPVWLRAATWAMSHKWESLQYRDRKSKSTKRVSKDTARFVFLACCERARRDALEVFRCARREIAELAGVRSGTAGNALLALEQAGFVLNRGYNRHGAHLIAFPQNVQKRTSNIEWFNIIGTVLHVGAKSDLFSNGKGLGRTAGRVLDVIAERPRSVQQIAERLDCDESTVRRALGKLAGHSVARKVGKCKWIGERLTHERINEIAQVRGALGKGQARKDLHARERARFVTLQMLANKHKKEKLIA